MKHTRMYCEFCGSVQTVRFEPWNDDEPAYDVTCTRCGLVLNIVSIPAGTEALRRPIRQE